MTVHEKLNAAREEFHSLQLKKTGKNTFAGYSYFELGDFLIPALGVFRKHGLCGVISFDAEFARMSITSIEDGDVIEITSPMGSAALKGCHEVQNIGAVETYQRRYLWVTALEIVEHDALDAVTGKGDSRQSVQFISDAQRAELTTLGQQAGADMKSFCTYYKIGALPDLPANRFEHARAMLNKKLNEKTEQKEAA